MKTRSLTAIFIIAVYAAVLLGTVYVHKIFFDVFVVLLMLTAAFEMSRALTKRFSAPIDIFILINCIGGYAAFYFFNYYFGNASGLAAYFGAACLVMTACTICVLLSKRLNLRNAVSTMLVIIYPVTILAYMLGLNYLPYADSSNMNIAAIFLMFLVSSFSDTFAYLVGSTLKGPKLCPAISPKKTVSGAIGGLIGGVLGAGILLLFSFYGWLKIPMLSPSAGLNVMHYLVIGFIGSMFTQLGDLVASYVKRRCGIKDFSKLLPGHGGIMDRIDGFMLNAVFIYVYFLALAY